MKKIAGIIGLSAVIVLIAACSSVVAFKVLDRDTGREIPEYTIQINGQTLYPGQTVTLTNAAWKEFRARVQAEGYRVEERQLEKTVKPVPLVLGILLFWPTLGWCYGPEDDQVFYLIKNKE